MAIALVTSATPVGGANGNTTAGVDTTGANLIVLTVVYFLSGPVITVSDSKGNTWTSLTARSSAGAADSRTRLFYCINPTVGSGHTFTVAGTNSFSSIGAMVFSGASALDQESGAGGNSLSIQPGSITPAGDNEVFVTCFGWNPDGAASINSGFTELTELAPAGATNFGHSHAYKIQTTGGAENPTWTKTGTSYAICTAMATFTAAGDASNFNYLTLLGVG